MTIGKQMGHNWYLCVFMLCENSNNSNQETRPFYNPPLQLPEYVGRENSTKLYFRNYKSNIQFDIDYYYSYYYLRME